MLQAYGRLGAPGHNAAARAEQGRELVSVNVMMRTDVQVSQMRGLNQMIVIYKAVQVPISYQQFYTYTLY